jgi:putative ABC transport system ATP-binding protein
VRRSYIGFVFQAFHLVAHASVLENVAMPLYYAGLGRAERTERARALLARVGLSHRAHGRPSQLSGGEKQRTAIARALSCSPRLVLADEPTGALDSRTGAEILDLLMELRSRDDLTLLLVTHDLAVAARADRRVYLFDGRITAHATTELSDAR